MDNLETLVKEALGGSRSALERLFLELSRPVHSLALKMLWHPSDAEDATQEILLKVMTRLSSFRGESQVMTWVHSIAFRHLLRERAVPDRAPLLSFDALGDDLVSGLVEVGARDVAPEHSPELVEEVRVGCTLGMLRGLDPLSRATYILGEILRLDAPTGGKILELSPVAFRQRLSRARRALESFMSQRCGLVESSNRCRCSRQVPHCLAGSKIDPGNLLFASSPGAHRLRASIEETQTALAVFRSNPEPAMDESHLAELLRSLHVPKRFLLSPDA